MKEERGYMWGLVEIALTVMGESVWIGAVEGHVLLGSAFEEAVCSKLLLRRVAKISKAWLGI